MTAYQRSTRRGTVLLMVVSLLAMLFVLVSGFLLISRFDDQTADQLDEGSDKDVVLANLEQFASNLIGQSLVAGGSVMGGKNASWTTIPGGPDTYWLASLNPVWSQRPAVDGFPPAIADSTSPFDFANQRWVELASNLQGLVYPAVTAMAPYRTEGDAWPSSTRSVLDLIPEYAFDDNAIFDENDIIEAVRSGWMDADGDGIPDSDLLLQGFLGELANSVAGAPVRVPTYVPGAIPASTSVADVAVTPWLGSIRSSDPGDGVPDTGSVRHSAEEMFRTYMDGRDVDVAMRIVSHGGMIALDAADVGERTLRTPVQRGFMVDLFRTTLSPDDNDRTWNWQGDRPRRFFGELAAQRGPVEAALRNRGFLPPSIDATGVGTTPQILSVLQGDDQLDNGAPTPKNWHFAYPNTFVSSLTDTGDNTVRPNTNNTTFRQGLSQRINIADNDVESDVTAARHVTTGYDERNLLSLDGVARRGQITTISRSDELARRTGGSDNGDSDKLRDGELKFYLGEIIHAFAPINSSGPVGSNTADYFFAADADTGNGLDPGTVVIQELVRYYSEMLRDSGNAADWDSLPLKNATAPSPTLGDVGTTLVDDTISTLEQAYMLAVNTVAFAAPRSSDGWIPTVRYTPPQTGTMRLRTYVGYGPQPVISKAVIVRDTVSDSPVVLNDMVAVQLYNPNSPYLVGGVDAYGLNPRQFRVQIDGIATGVSTRLDTILLSGIPGYLDPSARFGGRTFVSVISAQSLGDADDFFPGESGRVRSANGDDLSLYDSVRIRVERAHRDETGTIPVNGWWPVDEITINVPNAGNNADDFRWRARSRNTTPAWQLGTTDGSTGDYWQFNYSPASVPPDPNLGVAHVPRWNVMTGIASENTVTSTWNGATLDFGRAFRGPHILRDAPPGLRQWHHPDYESVANSPFTTDVSLLTPTTPFPLMNAGLPTLSGAHGDFQPFDEVEDQRPRSFPTVGFMHYIPRFAHVVDRDTGGDGQAAPMSALLANEFRDVGNYVQDLEVGFFFPIPQYPADFGHMPVFDNRVTHGESDLPWGQMVYDYFTTLDSTRDHVDPLRVPGRIDINSASPLVLSALRMMNPTQLIEDYGAGDHRSPAPDFWWDVAGGVLGEYVNWADGSSAARFDAASVGGFETGLTRFPQFSSGQYRLGTDLAYAIASYRDNLPVNPNGGNALALSSSPGAAGYRSLSEATVVSERANVQGGTRGFESVGELLNVKGFDGTRFRDGAGRFFTPLTRVDIGDYIGAVTMMSLLDTQNLTTRSNTFTIYTSLMDRTPGQLDSSIRSQMTIDRSNVLPQLEYSYINIDGWPNASTFDGNARDENRVQIRVRSGATLIEAGNLEPTVISQKRGGYFNATYSN